jgi:hypothetical protein
MQLHSAVKYPCSPLITFFFFASFSSMNGVYIATSTCRSIQSCHRIGIADVIQMLVILFSEDSSFLFVMEGNLGVFVSLKPYLFRVRGEFLDRKYCPNQNGFIELDVRSSACMWNIRTFP